MIISTSVMRWWLGDPGLPSLACTLTLEPGAGTHTAPGEGPPCCLFPSMNGALAFVDTSDCTVMNIAEHYMASDVEWDPTGRYVITSVSWWSHKVRGPGEPRCHVDRAVGERTEHGIASPPLLRLFPAGDAVDPLAELPGPAQAAQNPSPQSPEGSQPSPRTGRRCFISLPKLERVLVAPVGARAARVCRRSQRACRVGIGWRRFPTRLAPTRCAAGLTQAAQWRVGLFCFARAFPARYFPLEWFLVRTISTWSPSPLGPLCSGL